jgi:hypothetical protein
LRHRLLHFTTPRAFFRPLGRSCKDVSRFHDLLQDNTHTTATLKPTLACVFSMACACFPAIEGASMEDQLPGPGRKLSWTDRASSRENDTHLGSTRPRLQDARERLRDRPTSRASARGDGSRESGEP